MFCKKCGKQLKDGALFCKYCGEEVVMPMGTADNKSISPRRVQNYQESSSVDESVQVKSNGSKTLILVSIIGILVIAILVLVCVMFLGKSDDKEDKDLQGYEDTMDDLESEDEPEEFEPAETPAQEETAIEPEVEPESEEEQEEPASQYFLPESDSRYMSMSELEGFTAADCRLARNELYARHGRRFNDENLQAYFDSCEWYQGTVAPEDFDESVLNEYEIANRDLIVKYEKNMGF